MRAVYDDIMTTRKTDWINNFWKAIAHDPALLRRTWQDIKEVMAPGALDPLTKEMVYLAVSVTNGCAYCIASHTAAARKAGMTEAMFGELQAGLAWPTKRNAGNRYQVVIDEQFKLPFAWQNKSPMVATTAERYAYSRLRVAILTTTLPRAQGDKPIYGLAVTEFLPVA